MKDIEQFAKCCVDKLNTRLKKVDWLNKVLVDEPICKDYDNFVDHCHNPGTSDSEPETTAITELAVLRDFFGHLRKPLFDKRFFTDDAFNTDKMRERLTKRFKKKGLDGMETVYRNVFGFLYNVAVNGAQFFDGNNILMEQLVLFFHSAFMHKWKDMKFPSYDRVFLREIEGIAFLIQMHKEIFPDKIIEPTNETSDSEN